jgi:hypothetical protein|tara:strand:+ start:26354 stop:26812 length:459 start_codon:yes stop_codon:yes gene_type:complete
MSQSDYLKHKRVSTQLRIDNDTTNQPAVFSSNILTHNQQYSLVNTIPNSKPTYNQLLPSGSQIVFDMETKVSNCPTFPVCNDTNLRTNRVPMTVRSDPSIPTPEPLNIWERGWDSNASGSTNLKNGCKCVLSSKDTDANICSCKVGAFGIVR